MLLIEKCLWFKVTVIVLYDHISSLISVTIAGRCNIHIHALNELLLSKSDNKNIQKTLNFLSIVGLIFGYKIFCLKTSTKISSGSKVKL